MAKSNPQLSNVQPEILYEGDVMQLLGASRSGLRALVKRGEFPKPFPVGTRKDGRAIFVAWTPEMVKAGIEALKSRAKAAQATA